MKVMVRRWWLIGVVAGGLVSCSTTGTASARYTPDSGDLWDAPWPTNDRLVDGRLDLSGFPNPEDLDLLDQYLTVAQSLDGWGPASPIYFPFRTTPSEELLPSPTESVTEVSGIILANVDPDSPEYGQVTPVEWQLLEPGVYTPHPTLAVQPLSGFPLLGDTTYTALLTTDVASPNEAFELRLESGEGSLAPLAAALDDLGLRAKDIAVGTVFTTRDPLDEMDRLVKATRAIEAPILSQQINKIATYNAHNLYSAQVSAPLWQHGEVPYASTGGGFRFLEDGTPEKAEDVTLRLAISVPRNAGAAPADGFPVVLYAHGTGGAFDTFADSSSGLEPASLMARVGMVGIGFDQPLHGERGNDATDVDMHTFNYLNPDSARANFRQGALDIIWLVHALERGEITFVTDESEPVPIDSSQIYFEGHSQGGLTGTIAGPWLGGHVRAAVISGAGGGLSISVVERKDPFDIAELVATLLRLGPGETLSSMHPIVGMVQLLAEETDPIHYAPYFHAIDGGYSEAPLPALVTSGRLDVQTDYRTANALAVAARLPVVSPSWDVSEAMKLRQLPEVRSPSSGDAVDWSGAPLTSGFTQWEDGDHFVIFDDGDAGRMVQKYFATHAAGEPVIDTRPE